MGDDIYIYIYIKKEVSLVARATKTERLGCAQTNLPKCILFGGLHVAENKYRHRGRSEVRA